MSALNRVHFIRLRFAYFAQVVLCLQGALVSSSTQETPLIEGSSSINEVGASVSKAQSHWKTRLQKFIEVGTSSTALAGLAGSSDIAMSAAAAAYIEYEQLNNEGITADMEREKMKDEGKVHSSIPSLNSLKEKRRFQTESDYDGESSYKSPFDVNDEVFAREGGKLIARSFGFIRRSLGLVGDTVRVVGDTTAGLTGSSIKVMGTAIKSVSYGIDSLGEVVNVNHIDETFDEDNFIDNTRSVTGKSIKLIGSLVRGVGDSIVMAGHATETVTSSSAGVAEDAVRVFESLARSLSSSFSLENHVVIDHADELSKESVSSQNSEHFISYGTKPSSFENDSQGYQSLDWFDALLEDSFAFLADVMADSESVPSLAPQFLGVLVILYCMSIRIINQNRPLKHCSYPNQFDLSSDQSHLLVTAANTESYTSIKKHESKRASFWIKSLLLSKLSLLLSLYILSWFYICHIYVVRTRTIMRNAEVRGYRNAIDSIESLRDSSVFESALWLNSLFVHMWRVSYPLDSDQFERKLSNYPSYIKNAMSSSNINKKIKFVMAYGGVEPYISEIVGGMVVEALKTDEERPSDVAYVSLDSFTLGSQPPIIRGIKVKGRENKNILSLALDVDALLSDLSVVLLIKLSSLDRAILPSTKLSINAVDAKLPLDVSLSFRDTFPFVSNLQISLSEMPKLKVKITPLSEASGLKGVDLGSLPLLSKWIQDSIDAQILQYVTPRFIAVDVPNFLGTDAPKECQRIHVIPPAVGIISPVRRNRESKCDSNENDGVQGTVHSNLALSTLPQMPKLRKTKYEGKHALSVSSNISLINSNDIKRPRINNEKEEYAHDKKAKLKKKEQKDIEVERVLRSLGRIIKRSCAPLAIAVTVSSVITSLNKDDNK